MTEERITIVTPAGEIAAWRGGAGGEAAVLLHGGPGLNEYLESLSTLLAHRFRTIRYQQRGVPPTTVGPPYTVDAHVSDAVAVIDQVAGGRAWIVGHSWGGHLALHMLVACPDRIAGAVIIDPLGAYMDVMEEFGANLRRGLSAEQQRRFLEIDAREEAGDATVEESLEALGLIWANYFADPAAAPPMPVTDFRAQVFLDTMASAAEHGERGTLVAGLPGVPAGIPVVFVWGAQSPFPEGTTPDTAALVAHARVEAIQGAGHFLWLEQPQAFLAALDM